MEEVKNLSHSGGRNSLNGNNIATASSSPTPKSPLFYGTLTQESFLPEGSSNSHAALAAKSAFSGGGPTASSR
jgi:hypothetical protein